MYKDLSLKEKAKVLLYGGKLGLTSVEDIAKLYDEAIGHTFLGDTKSQMDNSSGVLKWNEELLDFVYDLPEAVVSGKFVSRGNPNYDRAISNTYDLWKLGYLTTSDINNMRRDVRNNVLGERTKRAVQEGMDRAGNKIFPYLLTLGNPAAIATLAGGELVNSTVNNITEGLNESWGSLVSDKLGIETPWKRTAMELTNPFYLPGLVYGGTKLLYNTAKGISNLGRAAKLTAEAFRFNTDPINKASGATMDYPWQRQSIPTKDITITSELVPSNNSNIQYNISNILPVNNNVYSLSSGKPLLQLKEPVNNPFVDANGNINEEAFNQYMNSYLFGELTTPPSNPFVANPSIASKIDKTGFTSMVHPSPLVHGNHVPVRQHMIDVAKSALTIPLPSGVDRLSLVTTALFHDIGEMMGRERHGPLGRYMLENEPWIKENPLGELMLDAIQMHMSQQHLGSYNILQALRAADAARGLDYLGSKLRWPSFYDYSPLRQVYDSSKETAESNLNFINRFNEYFAKYGDPNNPQAQYPLIRTDNLLDTQGINQLAKDIIARHNTFIRGVRDFKYNENVTEEAKQLSYLRMRELGLDPDNRTDRINFTLLYYVPGRGTGSGRASFTPNEKYGQTGVLYTSNSLGTGAGYATSMSTGNAHNGEVALVRRPYKLGEDRDLWMQEGDFVLRDYQEGPYYDVNENAKLISNEKGEIRNIKLKAWEAWKNDPLAIQLRQLSKDIRDRLLELGKMRQELEVKFAPDDIKDQAYQIIDERRQTFVNDAVNRINNILQNNNLKPISAPQKASKKLAIFYKNFLNQINNWDLYDRDPKNIYWLYKNSKVTPSDMSSYGLAEHENIGAVVRKLLQDKDLVQDGRILRDLFVERDNLDYEADQLYGLYEDMFMESYKPDLTYADFYKIPKSDELNIYTSEGIYKPLDKRPYKDLNYLHYLFPGPIGEKALDLVKWINRTEWVNNPDLDVTRGHRNTGGYPEATLKTFGKGGSIYIKPENRGKFTALKKRTGHSASWFKAHGTPALKKMATFALNAKKWHHKDEGGYIDDIIWDNMGLWNPRNYGKPTGIQGDELGTYIVNNDDPQNLVAVDNYGNTRFIPANTRGPFYFPGSSVVEYPLKYQFGGLFKKKPKVNYLYSTYGLNDYDQPRYEGSYNNPIFGYQPLSGINQPIGRDYSMPDYSALSILSYPIYMNEPPVKPKNSVLNIVDFLWTMENGDNVGMNQDGTYSRYRDPNGRDYDVGPGLVIGKAIKDKKSYTKKELDEAAYNYYLDSMSKLLPLYDNKYGEGLFDKLDDSSKMVIFDVMYRVGLNGVTPDTWPNLFDAAYNNDVLKLLSESRSKFKNKGKWNYDNARVKRIGEYLYPDVFDYQYKNSLDPNLKINKKQYGGLIKPFSYTDIPVVRYGDGGYFYI